MRVCPWLRAKSCAPCPTSMTWAVFSMTRRAVSMGLCMRSSAATDPMPYWWFMMEASRVTLPVLSGLAPSPTQQLLGSFSETCTPASTASRALPLFWRMFQAASLAVRDWLYQVLKTMGPLFDLGGSRVFAFNRLGKTASKVPMPKAFIHSRLFIQRR